MKKCGEVGIALIHLIPQTGELAGLEVAADQQGLARPGRRPDPDHRLFPLGIEALEQARAHQ
ncbi:MAG: hypothetical protein ACREXU_01900, partial [Gammaproteobacteria bacterium]